MRIYANVQYDGRAYYAFDVNAFVPNKKILGIAKTLNRMLKSRSPRIDIHVEPFQNGFVHMEVSGCNPKNIKTIMDCMKICGLVDLEIDQITVTTQKKIGEDRVCVYRTRELANKLWVKEWHLRRCYLPRWFASELLDFDVCEDADTASPYNYKAYESVWQPWQVYALGVCLEKTCYELELGMPNVRLQGEPVVNDSWKMHMVQTYNVRLAKDTDKAIATKLLRALEECRSVMGLDVALNVYWFDSVQEKFLHANLD